MNKINSAVDTLDDILHQYYQEHFKGHIEVPNESKDSILLSINRYKEHRTRLIQKTIKISLTMIFLSASVVALTIL